MKLISYQEGGAARYGAVKGDGIVDISRHLGARFPSLRDALAGDGLAEIAEIVGSADADRELAGTSYLLPITGAIKILCAGRNYRAYHEVVEDGKAPEFPSIFGRFTNGFVAHGEAILKSPETEKLDYEGELCAVIGKRGRYIDTGAALDHVAGYTVMNEGTAREWASRGTQNTPAKNFYKSGGIGPWMVTADEIADPSQLHIWTRRNGDVVQDAGTDMMIFDLPFLIAHTSKFTWLEPGDIIATGSPGGSIMGSEDPDWLKPGDVVEVEVSGVGTLSNPIEAE